VPRFGHLIWSRAELENEEGGAVAAFFYLLPGSLQCLLMFLIVFAPLRLPFS